MMNLSRIFILRPIATSLLMVALFLVGMLAYGLLPVSSLPEVSYPTLQVSTFYPGCSPEVMASSVTAPLERQLGQMPGLKQMSSISSDGASVIVLQCDLDMSLDTAEQQVQAALNAANALLPNDLPTPPIYNKVNPADTPVVTLAISSETRLLHHVEDLVDTRMAQKISQLPGVGLVSLVGGQRPAIRIVANPRALSARGLSLEDLRIAVQNANVNIPKGSFDGPQNASTIDANDQLTTVEDYTKLIIAYKNDAPIRLEDVASVVQGPENIRLGAWANQKPAIIVNVQRQPGANMIEVVESIKKLLPQIASSLPQDLKIDLLTDRTTMIRASIEGVHRELMISILLVIAVIYLFLRNVKATFIPSVAVPLSLIGTFSIMKVCGFSLNNLSLMALTVATGFVVDDAIVMIENIARYLEKGEKPLNAALKGARQIGFTIISLTVSLIAVLIPLLFMGDVIGRLFREFAVTLAVSIILSALISLTLTPMMCAQLLKPLQNPQDRHHGFFTTLIHRYAHALEWVLHHQKATLGVTLLTLIGTVSLYMVLPKGLFPCQDTGLIQGISEAPQSISYPAMAQRQQDLARALLEDPDVESLSSFIGVDGTNMTLNSGRLLINLKPHHDRDSINVILGRLQERASHVQGIRLYLQPVQDLNIEDRVSRSQYQLTLQDVQTETLNQWVPELTQALSSLPPFSDVTSDLQNQGLQAYLLINRDHAARVGVTTSAISHTLYNAYAQRFISTILTQTNQYRVILEASPPWGSGLQGLQDLYVPSLSGSPIPLKSLVHVEERYGPLSIQRQEQFPSSTLSFNLRKGFSLGDAIQIIRDTEKKLPLPQSLVTRFQGAAAVFSSSLSGTLWLIFAAIVTMYIVLGVLYESYIHPITILSTLPSAIVGAFLALLIAGSELGIMSIMGLVLLIGIVKKNAILMIDFALEAQRVDGLSARDAIYQACLLRLRPILMTTLSALLGALPLMLGTGVGSELRHPLGLTMVGGLALSQVLTLFTTPVIYLMFHRLSEKASRITRRKEMKA